MITAGGGYEQAAHLGGADDRVVGGEAGDLPQGHAVLRQDAAEHLVVDGGGRAEGLLAHVAGGDVQGLGDAQEHLTVQGGLDLGGRFAAGKKVGGKHGGGDEVAARLMEDEVVQVTGALLH